MNREDGSEAENGRDAPAGSAAGGGVAAPEAFPDGPGAAPAAEEGGRDCASLRRTLVALRESEERFRILFENMGEGVGIVDGAERFLVTNPAADRIFGVYPESLQGRFLGEFLLPGEIDRVKAQTRRRARGEAGSYELRVVRPDGGTRTLLVTVSPQVDGDGTFRGAFGVFRDITDARKAEEEVRRLAHAVEHSAESVVITDREANILYVNPAFERLTEYSREEVLGQNPRILKSGFQEPGFYADLWKALTAGETWRGRFVNRKKGGTLFVEEATLSPVLDADGCTVNYIAVKRDVTHEVLLEEKLREAQKIEAVGQLAGGVAHDFNNLLTAILEFAELALAEGGSSSGCAGHIQEIRRAAERGRTLTGQLLAFGRRQILQPKPLDLRETVSGMAGFLGRLLGEEIRVELDMDQEVWRVKADPIQMGQVLLNLALNARDAMARGGVLTLSVHNEAWEEQESLGQARIPPGRYVVLGVADTGEGMPPEVRARIFDPFFTTRERGKGAGLGLSTVHGIVKQSGGEIWVTSEEGLGSLFQVFLPAMAGEEVVVPLRPAPPSQVPASRGRFILLAEDEEPVRRATALLLEHLGYSVLAASGVREARSLFDGDPAAVDILLTDMVMPDGSGTDLYEALSAVRPDLKVVFMSGYTDDRMIRAGTLSAAMAFLPKPFSAADLKEKFRAVLEGADSEEAPARVGAAHE